MDANVLFIRFVNRRIPFVGCLFELYSSILPRTLSLVAV